MPLGDICFLLRSGVIAAKNVPERRAGALILGWVLCACLCVSALLVKEQRAGACCSFLLCVGLSCVSVSTLALWNTVFIL